MSAEKAKCMTRSQERELSVKEGTRDRKENIIISSLSCWTVARGRRA